MIKIILLLLFIINIALPQKPSIQFKHLNVEDGLSQSSVMCILQDLDGFMWFGTEDGLNRYDGYNFKIFKNDPADSNTLGNNFIRAIYQDYNRQIWIGTGRGLNRYNPENGNFYSYDNIQALKGQYINTISLINKNELCITTRDNGFGFFDITTETFKAHNPEDFLDEPLSSGVRSAYLASSGEYFLATAGGIVKFNRQSGEYLLFKVSNLDNSISAKQIVEDDTGNLWFGSFYDGLVKFNLKSHAISFYKSHPDKKNSISDNHIIYLMKEKNRLWIGTEFGGVNILDLKQERFYSYESKGLPGDDISGNYIESIYRDRSGLIWIGTNASGLNVYDPKRIKFIHYKNEPLNSNSLSDDGIYALYEAPDKVGQELWIGTDKAGLNRLDRANQRFTVYKHDPANKNSISNNSVRAIYKDKSGILWVGTAGGGINLFDQNNEVFKPLSNLPLMKQLSVRTILPDPISGEQAMWIGTAADGLIEYHTSTGRIVNYLSLPDQKNGLNSNDIRAFYADKKGIIWLGTFSGGLNRLDPKTEVFKGYPADAANPNSITNNIVLSIYDDPTTDDQVLWLGTAGGINRFDVKTETFTHITENEGLPNNVVYSVMGDANGDLWISTNKGVTRYNPKDSTFRNYSISDGLQNEEFNAGAYFKSKSGEMFLGGIGGFNIFHPDSLTDNMEPATIKITSFKKFDKEVKLERNIESIRQINLAYNEDFFAFEFVSLDYGAPEKNQYAYKMEGFDKDWIYCGTRRYASYTNLDPGDYIFRVKGTNSDGFWNEKGTSIEISIEPPPWLTWWAYIIYLLGLVLLALGVRWIILNWKSLLAIRKRKISHYKLVERVGEGGMGTVFRAVDVNTNKIVALKVLKAEMLKEESNKKRFRHEGHLLTSLRNENIVKTHEIGESGNIGFIAMEFLTGGTLEEYLEANKPLSLEEIKRISLQICNGLIEIHSQKIYHRDIKTANIMLDADKNIRIMDFGLSKSPIVTTMTNLGTVMGTLGYVAPEQVTGVNVDHRTDIFSFGVLIYYMLTLKHPFNGENEMAMIHSIFNTEPEPPSTFREDVSSGYDQIVKKCLEKDPLLRYENAEDIKDDLLKI
ncbi:MAG: hypothetical protein D8M58_18145 [Calditrichaeota bacterium]|nr:MAG: hypothetical protein DWQ03_11375 [Calditrichota bacterium]MBL1207331.1 hypothetical protein [Calditrichota bacterium]NOG47164.1 protein kinase [Calditrichota bacterium]